MKQLLQSRPWLSLESLPCSSHTWRIWPKRGHICDNFGLCDLSREVGGIVTLHLLSVFWFSSLQKYFLWGLTARVCIMMILGVGGEGHTHDMWNFPGQGSNPSHSSNNARYLTCWATRELPNDDFVGITLVDLQYFFHFPYWVTIVEPKMFVLWNHFLCHFQLRIATCIWSLKKY